MDVRRRAKLYYLKFIRLKGDPKSLAMGAAIGIFIGITPTLPFHTVAIVAITIATRTSTIAGLLTATLVSNPLTFAIQYYLSMVIGNCLTPYELNWNDVQSTLEVIMSGQGMRASLNALTELGVEATVVLLTGGVVLALPFTLVGYVIFLRLFIKIRQKRRSKHILD
jgi:uncharacterized protein (DUF2062 family)